MYVTPLSLYEINSVRKFARMLEYEIFTRTKISVITVCCSLCASWDTTFLRRTLPCALVWTRPLCQDYTAAGWKFWKHASCVSPLAGQDFDSGKCASYFQEPLSWHTCHRFGGDWDWQLSQPDTQSLTWFDCKRRTFKSCIIYTFTSALQQVGLWRCALFDNFDSAFGRSTSKKINESSRASVLDFRFYLFAFLRCIIFLSYFFSSLHFWWQYHSQLICVMPLNTCNYAQTWWVCFGAVIALFLPFCLAALYLFSTFFFKFCTFDDSSHADMDSTTVSSFLWCHWVPATMHYPDEFLSEL